MKKRNLLSLITIFALCITMVTMKASAATGYESEKRLDVETYRSMIEQQTYKTREGFEDAQEFLKKFDALSKTQQEQFVNYLSDPEFLLAISAPIETGTSREYANGDVVVSSRIENTGTPESSERKIVFDEFTSYMTITIFDIKLTELYLKAAYYVELLANGTWKIHEHINTTAGVSKNFNVTANYNFYGTFGSVNPDGKTFVSQTEFSLSTWLLGNSVLRSGGMKIYDTWGTPKTHKWLS